MLAWILGLGLAAAPPPPQEPAVLRTDREEEARAAFASLRELLGAERLPAERRWAVLATPFEALLREHPATEAARDARLLLLDALEAAPATVLPRDRRRQEAAELLAGLLRWRPADPALEAALEHLHLLDRPARETFLEFLFERSPAEEMQAAAVFLLAREDLRRPGFEARERALRRFAWLRARWPGVLWQGRPCGELAAAYLEAARRGRPHPGDPAPPTRGLDSGGRLVDLAELRGEVVVLFFWGDWGSLSRVRYPEMAELHRLLQERGGGRVLGVNSDRSREILRRVEEREDLPFASLLDAGGTQGPLAETWGVRGWPAAILVGPDGVVRERGLWGEELREAALALLGKGSR